ncbi:MAG: glycoside hydrolase family 43 protein [Candidatus Promineofilum sp.]|nr:glycoside hydrolase family 43 protein [Promineifilum sp.]
MIHRLVYQNPVFAGDFPDPFVLKYCGEYWAYCTGIRPDGRAFGILHSRDLVHWQELSGALEPLPGDYPCYWAPEVSYDNGRFYLYYSVGDEATMHIRVATADHPAGPFVDQGLRLTQEPFAIDAHVFAAPDGRRYLFYATDFLEHERIGTGTVVDRLLDPLTLAGQPHPVSRARHDWQIYDPSRKEKGGVRWHTIEGPFVLERKGVYYQMFSGGNWQNPTYGVSYATTRALNTPDEWAQHCDGEQVLPVLRTIPGKVLGPGHNSVVRGPDNRQLYCVYHRWGANGREMAIDPLDWAGERLLVLGPSHTPVTGPNLATFADFFDGPRPNPLWQATGRWQTGDGTAVAGAGTSRGTLTYGTGGLPFLAEVSVRAAAGGNGRCGLDLVRDGVMLLQLRLSPNQATAALVGAGGGEVFWPLPADFRFDVFHLLRVEVDGRRVACRIDELPVIRHDLDETPTGIALVVDDLSAAFAGFALTTGWQDSFDQNDGAPGPEWAGGGDAGWAVRARQLRFDAPGEGRLWRGPCLANYELVVNARLDDAHGAYGISPALSPDGVGPWVILERAAGGWAARWQEPEGAPRELPLPAQFDPTDYQQFRFRKDGRHLSIHIEEHEIATLPVAVTATCVGLYGRGAAAFDLVRVSAIPS